MKRLNLQKIFLLRSLSKKILLNYFIVFLILFVSLPLDINGGMIGYSNALFRGIPQEGFLILSLIRFLSFYLLYLYLFSCLLNAKNKSYVYLIIARMKKIKNWYHAQILYSLILSFLFWGIYIIFGLFVIVVLGLENTNHFIFQQNMGREVLIFYLCSILSSLMITNLFTVLRMVFRNGFIGFSGIVLLIVLELFSFELFENRTFLFINNLLLIPSQLTNKNIILHLGLWLIQMLFCYLFIRIYSELTSERESLWLL